MSDNEQNQEEAEQAAAAAEQQEAEQAEEQNNAEGGDEHEGGEDSAEKAEAVTVEDAPVEDKRAAKHGSHDAAMAGLQTDASGTYTPPGQL